MSAIVSSPDGGVFAAGYTLGTFLGMSGSSIHTAEPYIAKFDASGQQQWVQQFFTGAGDFISDATGDSSGNVFLCGSTLGAFPGFTNSSGIPQALIVKYDPIGRQVWVQQFAIGGQVTNIVAAAVSPSGQLFVAGDLISPSTGVLEDLFVAAVDGATGSLLWQQTFGTNASNSVDAIAVDGNGGLFLSGASSGPFPGSNSQDVQPFVIKLATADGHLVWTQSFPDLRTTSHLVLSSIAIAPDSNLIVGGAKSIDYVVAGLGAYPNASALLLKLSSDSGNILWQQSYSSGTGDQIASVRTLGDGTIYAAGSTNGVLAKNFRQPNQDMFLLKCDASGSPQWVQQFGTGPVSGIIRFGVRLAVNGNDVFVGGATQGVYPGASNPLNAVEAFVAKFGR